MFEKEAEYYAKEKYSPNTDPFIIAVADDAFKDGAEFGYNKANEQIEKLKNCKNCSNYLVSGKCGNFSTTGICKNWEMQK